MWHRDHTLHHGRHHGLLRAPSAAADGGQRVAYVALQTEAAGRAVETELIGVQLRPEDAVQCSCLLLSHAPTLPLSHRHAAAACKQQAITCALHSPTEGGAMARSNPAVLVGLRSPRCQYLRAPRDMWVRSLYVTCEAKSSKTPRKHRGCLGTATQ
jgi:hypothetical protein